MTKKSNIIIKLITPTIKDYLSEDIIDDPLDGDAVDGLMEHLKNKINLHEGNITLKEYNKLENI